MKNPKKNRLIVCIVAIIILIATCFLGWFLFQKKNDNLTQQVSLGEQQNQQTQQAVLQLASNLLGNADNLNQLIRKPDGSVKPIQEIEEEFLISIFSQTKSPISDISGNLSPEIIEKIWWELRPWIEEYLKDLNKSILDHGQEKFLHDLEKWLKWQQKEYQHQLEEYRKRFQELKKIEDLIAEYQKIREKEFLEKTGRRKELVQKGYSDRDIEKLKEWDLLKPEQEIPDLVAEKRIGATNILWTSEQQFGKIGGSSDLVVFLKPKLGENPRIEGNFDQNNSQIVINFSTQIAYNDKESYKQFIRDFLIEKGKSNYDVYCLIRTDASMSGDSAGIAFYLALHSLINQTPLPRNLGSTGTVFERPKVGAIGGLNLKLEWNVKKEKSINIFILSENNKKCEWASEQSWEHISSQIKEKIKQVHFVSNVDQIKTALQEILKNPKEKLVHSCQKNEIPERKPEKPEPREPPQPNSEITSDQVLSLAMELSLRKNQADTEDLREKLQTFFSSNPNYQKAFLKASSLHGEYLEKLKPDNSNKAITKKKLKIHEEIYQLEEQIKEERKRLVANEGKISQLEQQKTEKENELQQLLNSPNQPELNKEQIYQEYQSKFQKIASSVNNLTTEIITNLANNGYNFIKITWTGELHAPSLTSESSVSYTLQK